MNRNWYPVLLITLSISMLEGCQSAVNKAVASIDSAILAIGSESSNWQGESEQWKILLEKVEKDLSGLKTGEYSRQVQTLIDRSSATLREDAQGSVDFLGDRLIQGLTRIRADLLNIPRPIYPPKIVRVIPDIVTLQVEASQRAEVIFSGYDLDSPSDDGGPARLFLLRDDNSMEDVTASLNRNTYYRWVCNVSETPGGIGQTLTHGRKLLLCWGQKKRILAEIGIVQRNFEESLNDLEVEYLRLKKRTDALEKLVDAANRTGLIQSFKCDQDWDGYGHEHRMQIEIRAFMNFWPKEQGELGKFPIPQAVAISTSNEQVIEKMNRNSKLRKRLVRLQLFIDSVSICPMVTAFHRGEPWDGFFHEHHMQDAVRNFMRNWDRQVKALDKVGVEIKDVGKCPPKWGKYTD